MLANQYLGAQLWTKAAPVSVFAGPGTSQFVYSIPKNSFIGKIKNWVIHDEQIWWKLDNPNPRYVKHDPNAFDLDKLNKSVEINKEKEAEKDQEKANDPVSWFDNLFGGLGGFGSTAIAILILIVIITIIKK